MERPEQPEGQPQRTQVGQHDRNAVDRSEDRCADDHRPGDTPSGPSGTKQDARKKISSHNGVNTAAPSSIKTTEQGPSPSRVLVPLP